MTTPTKPNTETAGEVPTPRTDKCEYDYYNPPIATPSRVDDVFKHARQLENELTTLYQKRAELGAKYEQRGVLLEDAEAERDALRAQLETMRGYADLADTVIALRAELSAKTTK